MMHLVNNCLIITFFLNNIFDEFDGGVENRSLCYQRQKKQILPVQKAGIPLSEDVHAPINCQNFPGFKIIIQN